MRVLVGNDTPEALRKLLQTCYGLQVVWCYWGKPDLDILPICLINTYPMECGK